MTHATPPTPGPRSRTFVPFNIAAVRTTYVPTETVKTTKLAPPAPAVSAASTTSTGPASPAVPAGLVELVATLRTAAHLPGVLVIVDTDGDTGAEATSMVCLPTAQIRLGAHLLDEQHSMRLQGALAHEIAHHALGHLSGPSLWRRIAAGCGLGALLVLAAHLPAWLVLATAAVAAVNHLLATQAIRLQECDADLYSARLLTEVGRDGVAIVTATLDALPAPTLWQRTVGRLTASHPTPDVRLRVLASGRAPSWFSVAVR
ncbi:M48 family metalloprotease [Streptosporangium sp. V21-05]|uniref:M48 family metalloprotease n=1 Tax=Streptosporangium sp. V21-05 TaxID=3446115 RepID=UPI003F531695